MLLFSWGATWRAQPHTVERVDMMGRRGWLGLHPSFEAMLLHNDDSWGGAAGLGGLHSAASRTMSTSLRAKIRASGRVRFGGG